jgi:hypothetical protein
MVLDEQLFTFSSLWNHFSVEACSNVVIECIRKGPP